MGTTEGFLPCVESIMDCKVLWPGRVSYLVKEGSPGWGETNPLLYWGEAHLPQASHTGPLPLPRGACLWGGRRGGDPCHVLTLYPPPGWGDLQIEGDINLGDVLAHL